MNTRTESMNNKAYCAYCGKELKDYNNCYIHDYPIQPLVCDCKKAKRELELYNELKKMYNAPLAESLIDMKVEMYRNSLLGQYVDCSVAALSDSISCLSSHKAYIVDTLGTTANNCLD